MTWRLVALLAALAACSSAPHVRDSPQFIECRDKCREAGFPGGAVVEDDERYQCFCKKPPETTWQMSPRGFMLAAARQVPPPPGIVILCATGIVTPLEEHFGGTLASGSHCVLHDRAGKTTSAEFLEVFDTTRGGP